jgi:hypothetical protein
VASANDPVAGDPNTFRAPDYDTLADHPADLGRLLRYDKTIGGVPFSVVMVGSSVPAEAGDERTDAFAETVFRIAGGGLKLLGRSAPFPRYIFHLRFSSPVRRDGSWNTRTAPLFRLTRPRCWAAARPAFWASSRTSSSMPGTSSAFGPPRSARSITPKPFPSPSCGSPRA